MLGLTDGNLASHLKTLEGLGYIDVKKAVCRSEAANHLFQVASRRQAFKVHLQALEALIRQTAD